MGMEVYENNRAGTQLTSTKQDDIVRRPRLITSTLINSHPVLTVHRRGYQTLPCT